MAFHPRDNDKKPRPRQDGDRDGPRKPYVKRVESADGERGPPRGAKPFARGPRGDKPAGKPGGKPRAEAAEPKRTERPWPAQASPRAARSSA
jgi:23S rRNA pseudouridine2605 synthase